MSERERECGFTWESDEPCQLPFHRCASFEGHGKTHQCVCLETMIVGGPRPTPPSLPEAVAGNASAPVGEKRQPSEVQQVPVQPSITQRGKNDGSPVKRDPANGPDSDLAGQPSGVGEPRRALQSILDHLVMVDENWNPEDSELRGRVKNMIAEADAALSTPSPTEGASSPAEARTELVQKEVGEGLREALERAASVRYKVKKYRYNRGNDPSGNNQNQTAELVEEEMTLPLEAKEAIRALAAPAPIPTEGLREGDEVLLRAKIYHIRVAGTNPRFARDFKLMVKDGDEEHVLFVTAAALTPAPKPAPPAERDDTDLEGRLNTGADFPS